MYIDVVDYLKQLGPDCPRVVRVYNEDIEQLEFPTHTEPTKPRRTEPPTHGKVIDHNMLDIALHHLIRKEGHQYSQMLRAAELNRNSQKSTVLQLISRLQFEELRNAEIILCTCVDSGAYRIFQGTHIRQV